MPGLKCADQTVWMHRLVCFSVVCSHATKSVLFSSRPIYVLQGIYKSQNYFSSGRILVCQKETLTESHFHQGIKYRLEIPTGSKFFFPIHLVIKTYT